VTRFLDGLRAHNDLARAEVVIVDNACGDGEWLEGTGARVVHLDAEHGWAAARNAGLKTSRGDIVVIVDLSIEPAGDILTPLRAAFAAADTALAGPFGLRSDDMRDWQPAGGSEAHAIEGYLLATRRALLRDAGLIHEKFRWYRNADIDLSFQLRAQSGKRARVVPLPVVKHAHRGWEALDADPEERTKRSKRNHYLFFDRWKTRTDLIAPPRA
jgi:cysteinyl-tRNA synthetase